MIWCKSIAIQSHFITDYLTLWLRFSDKSTHRTCLLGMISRQIDRHNSTIVPWIADKSAELIILRAR